MSPSLRQTTLGVRARLRLAGWAPWLGLAAWSAYVGLQEPSALRTSGVRLREPATWCAAGVLWLLLACNPPRPVATRFSIRLASNSLLLLLVAAVAWLLTLGLDLLQGAGRTGSAVSLGWFLLSLLPVSTAASVSDGRTQITTTKLFMAISLGPAAVGMLAAGTASGSTALIASVFLSITAAILLWSGQQNSPAPTPVRKQP